jgi:transposase-like protein
LLDTTTKYYLKWLYDNVPAPSPPRGNKRPTKDKRNAQMLKLYKQGVPIKAIAQRFGVSYQRVWQVVKERG